MLRQQERVSPYGRVPWRAVAFRAHRPLRFQGFGHHGYSIIAPMKKILLALTFAAVTAISVF